MTRLLMTVDAVGGVWQYGLDLARGLGALGIETVLAQMGPPPDDAQRAEAAAIPSATLIETGLPLDWLVDGPGPIRAAAADLGRLARESGADLIQCNMPTLAAALDTDLPVTAVAHGCVSTWWQAARPGVPLDPMFHWHRTMTGDGLRAADRVVAPTRAYGRAVADFYGLTTVPRIVHNGRAFSAADCAGPSDDRVLTAGRLWDGVKQAALLDRVASRLIVPFDAAGAVTGPHGETIRLDHLHALGRLDTAALAARMACRPVFVSAATFEPFGLAVLEAAQAGCALVLADIPGFRELWDGAALFVPPRDEQAYAAAIERLIGDAALRLARGEAARRHAARYIGAAMAAGMAALYAELTGTPARRAAA